MSPVGVVIILAILVLGRSASAAQGAATVPAPSPEVAEAEKLYNSGKKTEGKAALEAIARQDPKNADALFLLGRIAFAEQDFDGAVRRLDKTIAARPSRSTDHMWLGRAYAQKAIKASMLKRPFIASSVKKEMLKAVELDPENSDARFDLARFYVLAPGIMGGSTEKAIQQAAEIKKRDPLQGISATR